MTMPSLRLNSYHSILIICTGNICRSPMAEGLLKLIWPKDLISQPVIHSAGTHAIEGLPAEPYAIDAVKTYGVDISAHRSRPLDRVMTNNDNLILVMANQHLDIIQKNNRCQSANVHLLCGFCAGDELVDIPDPYGGSLRTYRECARMIYGCLERLVNHLTGNLDSENIPGKMS